MIKLSQSMSYYYELNEEKSQNLNLRKRKESELI
jgi:hypothetical protein